MVADGTLDALNATGNPAISKLLTERNHAIVAVLRECARELGRTPAQVALNWVARRPGVVSTLISVTRVAQLEDNLRALDFEIPNGMAERIQEVSRPEPVYPYYFSGPTMGPVINAGTAITAS